MSGTFAYVSNAEDGDIGLYAIGEDGSLGPGPRFAAGKGVMPMSVSPDRRFLAAAVRGETPSVHTYGIDPASGALNALRVAPLAANCPYIFFDRSGRFLLGASYGADCVVVHRVDADGTVGECVQVVPTARNAHCIRTDETNRYAFVPHLGTDQVFQFLFDEKTGQLTSNTPSLVQLAKGSGPRHLITSRDNRFAYVLAELTGTITTLALDSGSGLLTEVSSVSALPPGSTLEPGKPRGGIGAPASGPARDVSNDVWASDIHMTPDGRFLYAAERTRSTITTLSVDGASGKLTYVAVTNTEKQPRGFRIDPTGRFMIVSGEQSDRISAYRIDPSTGALTLIGRYPGGKGANWVEIASVG